MNLYQNKFCYLSNREDNSSRGLFNLTFLRIAFLIFEADDDSNINKNQILRTILHSFISFRLNLTCTETISILAS